MYQLTQLAADRHRQRLGRRGAARARAGPGHPPRAHPTASPTSWPGWPVP